MSETIGQQIITLLQKIDRKLDRALYEDGFELDTPMGKVEYTPEEIIRNGTRISYNQIYQQEDIKHFKQFLYYIATHQRDFSQQEVDYARFADKGFEDVRMSDNHVRILQYAFMKVHGQQWSYKMKKGYMYKYKDQIAWEWL